MYVIRDSCSTFPDVCSWQGDKPAPQEGDPSEDVPAESTPGQQAPSQGGQSAPAQQQPEQSEQPAPSNPVERVLAETGANVAWLIGFAIAFILLGFIIVMASRRHDN